MTTTTRASRSATSQTGQEVLLGGAEVGSLVLVQGHCRRRLTGTAMPQQGSARDHPRRGRGVGLGGCAGRPLAHPSGRNRRAGCA